MPIPPPGYATHSCRPPQGGVRHPQSVQRPTTWTADPTVVDVSDNEDCQDQPEEAVVRRVPAANPLPSASHTNANSGYAPNSSFSPHPAFPPNPFSTMLPGPHPSQMGPLMPWGNGGWDPFGLLQQSMVPSFFSPFSLAAPHPDAFTAPSWPTSDVVPGNGTFHSSSVMVMSSSRGSDGQWQVEKYARSSLGHTGHQMHEVKEAYSNSKDQIEKMAVSRQLGSRGRRLQREYDRRTEEVVTTDEVVGLDRNDSAVEAFETDWRRVSSAAFPGGRPGTLGTSHRSSHSGPPQRAALLAGERGPAAVQQQHAHSGVLRHPPAQSHHRSS